MIESIVHFLTSAAVFIVVLGLLIFVHELGHFLLARLFGVGVETFSLGYGSRLFGFKIGRTDYRVSLFPLGGYCKMVGEEPGEEIDPDDIPVSFTHQHVLKRIPIAAAGPAFNLGLAVILLFGLLLTTGLIEYRPVVDVVTPEGPAEAAGMVAGDEVVAIDGRDIGTWNDMTRIIESAGLRAMTFTLRRGEALLEKRIAPQLVSDTNLFGETIQRHMIGIGRGSETFTRKLGVWDAFLKSLDQTYFVCEMTVLTVVKIIQGTVSTKTIGGPIMIAEMAGRTAETGLANLIAFVALISVNLAILNLLPIPVLDGGHLVFYSIELIIRRPVSLKIREISHQVGMFVLLLIMIYVFYNDIVRVVAN